MEPLHASTRITGGYFTKGDPSKPLDECYLFRNNDVIRYILFNFMNAKQRARCATVCKKMHQMIRSEEEFYKWQFLARYNVLKGCHRRTNDRLLDRMKALIDDPKTDYKKFSIPKETNLFGRLFQKRDTQDQTLQECEKAIERTVSAEPYFYQMDDQHLYQLKLDDPNNEYEKQAYHDALYPIAKLIAERVDKRRCTFPRFHGTPKKFALPTFLAMAEAIFRESKLPHHIMDNEVEQATSPDDLASLNKVLPHAKNLEMLTFASQLINRTGFSWTAGNGIAALKEGLIRAPKLRILHFQKLGDNLLDEKSMLALADIIIERQKIKKLKPIEEIRFGDESVRPDVAWKLVEALKDYPVPIVIYISVMGNVPPPAAPNQMGFIDLMLNPPFPLEDIRRVSNRINIRWDASCIMEEMKMNMCYGLNENLDSMRTYIHLSYGIKTHEDRRNKAAGFQIQ